MSAMITAKLASVCEICMGQAPNGASYNTSRDGYELIAGAGDFGEKKPAPGKWTTAPTKVSKPGDIILCIRATIGDCNWSDKEYCLGRGVAGLRGKTGRLDQGFLWHWLVHSSAALKAMGKGATFPQISKNDIASLQIPLPNLSEQKRIAGILDAADALRAKRREALAQLDTLLQSTFLDMFGDPVTNPMGWEISTIGSYVKIMAGFAFKSTDFANIGCPIIRISNLERDTINLKDCARIPPASLGKGKRFRIQPGDTLIAMSGATTGKLGFVPDDLDEEWYLNQRVGAFRIPDCTSVKKQYLRAILKSSFYQNIVWNLAGGAAQPNISSKQLESAEIPLPPIYLQDKFSSIVESVERQKAAMRAHLAELDTLFASLQSRAFNGEL